jgi:hypothetical protein
LESSNSVVIPLLFNALLAGAESDENKWFSNLLSASQKGHTGQSLLL